MTTRTPEKYSEILETLHVMLLEQEKDVENMPLERVEQELTKEGISVAPLISEVRNMIAKKQAQQKLDAARNKRIVIEKIAAVKKDDDRTNLREKIATIFNDLGDVQPTMASAFFRKLDGVDDDDLISILDDLEFLEQIDNDSEQDTAGK